MGRSQKRFDDRPKRVEAFDGSGARTRRRLTGGWDETQGSSSCEDCDPSSIGAMRMSCQPFAVFYLTCSGTFFLTKNRDLPV